MFRRLVAVLAFAWVAVAGPAFAQAGSPVLIAKDYFTGEGEAQLSLQLSRLEVETDIVGATARTVVVAQFQNPTNQVLEADFTLDLPPGSVVTGYALNVGEGMVDGVLVGRRKATQAYEARIRQGIDPGIAEVTRTNAFRTRVFPVLRGEGRTVRVEFVSPLAPDGGYVLPLVVAEPVGRVSIKVTVDGRPGSTLITAPKGLVLESKADGARHTASAVAEKLALSGALEVRPDERREPALLTRHRSGDVFFEIDDAAMGQGNAAEVRRVRIYWDASVSRRDDDLAREIALVRAYLDAARPETIDVVQFADGEPVMRTLASAEEVEAALKAVRYRGATSLAGLFGKAAPRAGACLFFSDGRVTLDSYSVERAGCPLFTVSTAADADRGFLQTLSAKSSGEHIDLAARTPEQALPILLRAAPRVAAVTGMDGQDIDFRVLPAGPGRFRIIGRAPLSQQVTVRLLGAWNGSRTYDLGAGQPRRHDGAGALWAAGRIAEMDATDRPDQDATLRLARRYSVASPAAVFLVLETAEDYARAEIEPPPSAEAFRAPYKQLVAQYAAERAEERAGRLEEVVEAWEAQKEWWNTRYPIQRRPTKNPRPVAGAFDLLARPVPADAPPPPPSAFAQEALDGANVEALIVTAQRREQNIQDVPIAVSAMSAETITVEVEAWNPDRPYLRALASAAPDAFWSVYEAQEREHGSIPAFYLDVGEHLFRAGRAEEARAVVTGALDLPSADTGTLVIVADRMMRYGDPERGIWLYEKIRFLEPDRPQPHRALALALIERVEKRGKGADARRDYTRALELLSEVILTPWSGRYDGVEMIALMEANRIIPRLRSLGVKPALDPRLIDLLDVDVRVVLDWNTDATDMDLWVKEPGGEQAMYSNPLTEIGGRMSNDMTAGYGPEEYLLRRAPDGRYEVRVNVFSVDRINPNGATTVRARIYRGFGRRDETSETLELELTTDADREALVGVVTVGRKP